MKLLSEMYVILKVI